MKNTTLVLFSLCLALSVQAEIRTWKDATGTHEIKAELVGVKAGKVTLKRENGTIITLPVASLSKEDQALLGGASGGGAAAAGEWPQWRGPNRDDISTETGLLKKWPDSGPKRAWVSEEAGLGYSGFAISGGKIYTMGLFDAEEKVICLDAATGNVFVMETNTGATGSESVAWLVDPAGGRVGAVATAPGFAGGLEFVDSGFGTEFGAYQPAYTSLRFAYADCFGTGTWHRWNATGAQPEAAFDGPGLGQLGAATIALTGGVPNGFASLWVARTQAFESIPVIEHLGGLHPVALQADAADFLRRSSLIALDAQGNAQVGFTQAPVIEGALLMQWLVYDPTARLVTASTFAVNRDLF